MSNHLVDSLQSYIDLYMNSSPKQFVSNARQLGKTDLYNHITKMINKTYIKPPKMIILDDYVNQEYSGYVIDPKEKDWESKIPNPNPYFRPISSPDEKTRAKARARRKKK